MTRHHAGTEAALPKVERVAITGMGFICPAGGTVWETALAMRKKRSAFFSHETILVADNRYGTVLRGATVSRVPDEKISRYLCGAERAVALLSAALRECTEQIPPSVLENTLWQIDSLLEPAGMIFSDRFQARHGIPVAALGGQAATFCSPRCLFFERLIQAVENLRQGKEQTILVGCTDSLVTANRLEELLMAGRLKDAVNPEGIMASEAAGIFLLERETAARGRQAHIYATIASWGRGSEMNPLTGGANPSTGRGLSEAFHEAFAMLDDAGASIGTVISDLNGERSRALEWAYTEGRITPHARGARVLRHPADTLGDCGAAMGAAIMVNAVAGFMLHHSAAPRVALTTSDEAGAARVICLEKGDRAERGLFFGGLRGELQKENHPALPEEEGGYVNRYHR